MFKPFIGDCVVVGCGRKNVPIVVKKGFCDKCNHKYKEEKKLADGKKPAKHFSEYSKHKPSGELVLFKTLLEVRGAKSQISGESLVGFDVRWFSHLLSKAAYPSFRLLDRNIVLKTVKEHEMWETQRHKLKNLHEWQWVLNLNKN